VEIDLSDYVTKAEISGLAKKTEIPNVSNLAPKANPKFTGSISLGRKDNS